MFLKWNGVNLPKLQKEHNIIKQFRQYGIVQETVPSSSHGYPKTVGAYLILHIASGKAYVGSHSNLYARRHQHNHLLKNNIHYSKEFQKEFNKNEELILFYIVTKDRDSAYEVEQKMLEIYLPTGMLFNTASDARVVGLNAVVSEETKRKLSEAGKGRKQSEEWVKKRIDCLRGKPLSKEHVEKIRTRSKLAGINPNMTKLAALVTSNKISIDGVEYCSVAEAMRKKHIAHKTVLKRTGTNEYPTWFYV